MKRSDLGKFVVLPRRWIVERSIAWLNRRPRLAKIGNVSAATVWHFYGADPSG